MLLSPVGLAPSGRSGHECIPGVALPIFAAHAGDSFCSVGEELDAASTKSLTGLGQLPFPAEDRMLAECASTHLHDLPQAIYAYAKLGSPHSVAPEYRATILEFLVRAMKALLRVDAVPRLPEKALRQLLLGIAFWGPCKDRSAGQGQGDQDLKEKEAGDLRQVLLRQSLDVWLQMESSATAEITRTVVASASLEFGVQAGDLSDAAATRFHEVQRPERVSGQSVDCLQSYERSVFKALEKLLAEKFRLKPPVPKLEALHPTSCCDVRLALPALKLAVEVGLKGDLFEGPREAWADAGWGRTAESELDHGPIPGDFVAAGLDDVLEDADQRWFNVDGEGEDLGASASSVPWQQLPALRIRLLRASGWTVVEIPYYDWRKLVKSEQQRFLGQLLKDAVPAFAQAKSDRTDFRFSAKTAGWEERSIV
ncbi:ercc6l [Symbiodinium sp. CCMP2456]|nr:ercc6l [Symbiodinium sp. CCMP2456]